MQMTRSQFNAFRKDAQTALDTIAAKYGVRIDAMSGSLRYEEEAFTLSLKVENVGVGGESAAARSRFEKYCPELRDFIGETFEFRGTKYALKDYSLSSPKYRILATGPDGKTYKFMLLAVMRAFQLPVRGYDNVEG